jgi:transcriptional regulator with XRE-family HTH domain
MTNHVSNNLIEAVKTISSGEAVAQHLAENLESKSLVHKLFGLRCSKGITQADLAKRMNCSQSRISKLENGEDDDIRLGDLQEYLTALGAELNITVFSKKPTIAEKAKHHVFAIKRLLDKLAGLANHDEKLAKPIAAFFGEYFLNIIAQLQETASALPSSLAANDPLLGIIIEMADDHADCPQIKPKVEECAAAS